MKINTFPSQLNPYYQTLTFKGSRNVRLFMAVGNPTETFNLFNHLPSKEKSLNKKNKPNASLFYYSNASWSGENLKKELLDKCNLLIKKGIDLNEQDLNGNTSLHYSVDIFNYSLFELILSQGANSLILNHEKKTPLMVLLDEYYVYEKYEQEKKRKALKELIVLNDINIICNEHTSFYFLKLLDILVTEHIEKIENHQVLIEQLISLTPLTIKKYICFDLDTQFNLQLELHPLVEEYLMIFRDKYQLEKSIQNNSNEVHKKNIKI